MKKERIYWGGIFLLGAVVLIINKLGYFYDVNIFNILLSVLFVGVFIKSLFTMNFTGILFPLAFICIIYDEQLGITAITPWTVLISALLGSIGLSMIFYKEPKWYSKYKNKHYEFETVDFEDESHIKLNTSFSGSIKYINTDKFDQADLKCSFGSVKVYFDNATLNNGNGIVKIDATCSGIELYIPKTWRVDNRIDTFFSGIDEKNENIGSSNNILTLVGNMSLSGIEIVYI